MCSSGAPGGYYFSERALNLLSDAKRVKEDDLNNLYLQTDRGKFAVTDTALRHQPANIMSLRLLEKYGLMMSDMPSFQSKLESL